MNKPLIVFFLIFASLTCFADDGPACGTEPGIESIILKGITIVPALDDLSKVPRKEGIVVDLQNVNPDDIETRLSIYLGAPLNEEKIENIKNKIIDFCNKNNIFATVIIPEQDISDGIVIIEILTTKIGDLIFSGQKWFASGIFERAIHLKKGEELDQNQMLNDLAFLNSNPSHVTDAFLSPGDDVGTTDVEFLTKDQFPLHFYIGGDSTGVQIVDRIRLFGGLRWDDAFHIGDVLSYQYTASPDFHQFQTHAASYVSNLPNQDLLTILGIYGQVYPVIPNFRTNGSAAQASTIYTHQIKPLYRNFKQQLAFGLTYKYLDSNLFFLGTLNELPITQQKINITEVQFGYYLTNAYDRIQLSLALQAIISPWKGLLTHQTDHAYDVLRPGSSVRFAYFTTTFGYRYQIWQDCAYSILINSQVATGPLPASDQYSLGGMLSVRGYEQAQYISDNAICGNFEFYLPGKLVIRPLEDRAQFLVFCDLAYGANYKMDTQFEHLFLGGVGPGFRYTIPPHFSLRADYGFRLNKIPDGSAMGRFYLSAILGY